MISKERAVIAAMIFGAVVATGCAKKDNSAADTSAAMMAPADTGMASSTPAMAPDTANTAMATKPATKKKTTTKKATTKTSY